MEESVRHFAKVLGASGIESTNHGSRFTVRDELGSELRVSVDLSAQRVMLVLLDSQGITRCSLDLAPVSFAFEQPGFPGRVTLRVGFQLVHIDGRPEIGVEVESLDMSERSKSGRILVSQGG